MKKDEYWALYNCSNLWGVDKTQKALKREAEQGTGEPWDICKKYFKIVKVRIEQLTDKVNE